MKEQILEKASEMFLNFGFKSVTMDDIAIEMGISKKTIYNHFKNKTKLVEEASWSLFEKISNGIDNICELEKNPIDELFEIKIFIRTNLKDEKSSPQYQLQKYYPEICNSINKEQLNIVYACISRNLQRGVDIGIYRKDIDIDFMARMYFNGITGIKNVDTFPLEKFDPNILARKHLEYHLRAIVSEKGLNKLLKTINENEK